MSNADEDMEETELSLTVSGNVKWYRDFGKEFGSFLKNYTYSYHMVHPFSHLATYPRGKKTCVYTKTWIWKVLALCFIRAKNLKQLKCSWDERTLTHCSMTLSVLKLHRNNMEWTIDSCSYMDNLSITMLHERSKAKNETTYCTTPYIWKYGKR